MKLYSNLLVLIALSCSNCFTIPSENIFKRDNITVKPECQKELDSTEEFICLGTQLNFDNYKTICPSILSEKCQKFYENPLSYFPICKDEELFQGIKTKEGIDMVRRIREVNCSTDGDGNLCPAAEITLKEGSINEEIVMNSCKSKKCYTALYNLLEETTKTQKTGVMANHKERLNDSKCTSQTKDDLNVTINDSSNNKTDSNKSNNNVDANSGVDSNIIKLSGSVILAIFISMLHF